MTESQKQLSIRQAERCETAREPVCKCRCGGKLHGAKRGSGRSFFEELPEDDPHHIDSAAVKREKRNAKARAKTEARHQAWLKMLDGRTGP